MTHRTNDEGDPEGPLSANSGRFSHHATKFGYCQEARPVDTIMAIDRFVNPEWLVEIEVDAFVAGD